LTNGQSVRLCGIDAPENRGQPGQPLGEEAKRALQGLIQAAGGRVIVSPAETDRYGRLVAEVFVSARNPKLPEEETLVNLEMVRVGMAYRYAQYADRCPNGQFLVEGEAVARSNRLGVWSDSQAVKPWDYRRDMR
jgi:micrococcal nuclease